MIEGFQIQPIEWGIDTNRVMLINYSHAFINNIYICILVKSKLRKNN